MRTRNFPLAKDRRRSNALSRISMKENKEAAKVEAANIVAKLIGDPRSVRTKVNRSSTTKKQ